jgi:hypothetical protein
MNTTELRIGRNINGTPMRSKDWKQFQADALAVLEQFAQDIEADESWTEVHFGTGTWTNAAGVTESEDSAVVTLYWSEHGLLSADRTQFELDQLESAVAKLADRYLQDAVALVHGRSNLVAGQQRYKQALENLLES